MQKLFHFTIINLCLFASSALQADTLTPFNGAYVGAGVGTHTAVADSTVNSNVGLSLEEVFVSSNPLIDKVNMKRNSAIGSIYLGYGQTWKKLYLSGELALSYANYKMSSLANTGLTQRFGSLFTISSTESVATYAKISPAQFGIFVRPGVLLTPTSLLYARIGASAARLSLNSNTSATKMLTVNTTPTPLINSSILLQTNHHIDRAVFQAGAGLEQAINEKFTVRLDYLYTYYGTINVSGSTSKSELALLTASNTQTVTISDQSMMLSLAYHFNV